MLDEILIRHCSPTLGGLKTAGLFNYAYSCTAELGFAIARANGELNSKGVFLHILCNTNMRALIYVCRRSRLAADLQKHGVKEYLENCGYDSVTPDYCIEKLKSRFESTERFPHEIGCSLIIPLATLRGLSKTEDKTMNPGATGKFMAMKTKPPRFLGNITNVELFTKNCLKTVQGLFTS